MKGRIIALALAVLAAAGCGQNHSWKKDLDYRLAVDFNKTRSDVTEYIRKYIPEVTEAQIDAWTESGRLENMEIDGQTMYFRNAAPNLLRIEPECKALMDSLNGGSTKLSGSSVDTYSNIPEILSQATEESPFAAPKKMRVKYTITVHPDVVPDGAKVRCWLPYPNSSISRQSDIRFIKAGAKSSTLNYFETADPNSELLTFSGESSAHSTLYMEIKATKGLPVTFYEEFEYVSRGAWYKDIEGRVKPYDTSSPEYREYTSERDRHIIFTPEIKKLADSLTRGLTNPYLQAKAIFTWINDNFPWASAREYSTIPNIPMYVLENGHGDCGQVSLLFITLCRSIGIPAHFESGFMMHPHEWNLHDWAEVYFEGVGWVPVDQSFGIPSYATGDYLVKYPDSKYFYLGGIDSWRMGVNTDFGMPLYPAKKYTRSETVDFQRGEVEWKGGNLYFPMWDYDMDITYL